MGNCLAINVNVPLEQLLSICFRSPRRKKLTDLQHDWERLQAAKVDTLRKIDESPQMRPLEQVNQWLLRVAALEREVERFKTDYAQESANKCLCNYCPRNCKKIYSLWEKIEPMDQQVHDLLSQKPDVIVEMPLVASAQRVPTESTTGLQSMLDEVWSYVQDRQDVGLIGLHGMGGVGKTTLLKAVNNKLCASTTSSFDLQLWVVVSKSPNLEDIQNYIGKSIGLSGNNWERKSREAKATDIYNVLGEKKYVLLLDDIWERFDLTEIGIPLPNPTNKSKVIFTTRSKQVCGQMKAKQIQVQCLKEEEAWNLFMENVGDEALNAHHAIPGLAKQVMRECSGLPLALVVVGRAMTCKKTAQEWEHAIAGLKRGRQSSTILLGEVFTPLKYSFDNLPNETVRSCLLYCSLYPEDRVIPKSELVDKWTCEDFMGESNDPRKDRINEAYDYIGTLVNASLLEEFTPDEVKMHDVVRDMMIHIGGDKLCVKARAGLTQIPSNMKWEHVERLSLMDNPIRELGGHPTECPNLKTMFLTRAQLTCIKTDFSKFVPNLQVLDLSANPTLTSLPDEIGELVHLQYLNLWQVSIQEIPVGLKKLVKLKYLNLEFTQVSKIPEGVLSSLKELSVFKWISTGVSARNPNFLSEKLVRELEGLAYLEDLTISADSKADISHLTSSITLLSCITGLTLTHFNDSNSLNILILREMKHLRHLLIGFLEKVEEIVVEEEGSEISEMIFPNGFNTSLQYLTVIGCLQLKNLSWLVYFPNTEKINVAKCPELQTLVVSGLEPFAKLDELYLMGLPKLESIHATPLSLPRLRRLGVLYGCNRLKELPLSPTSCEGGGGGEFTIFGEKEWWDELQWEDELAQTTFASSFQCMSQHEALIHYRTIQIISKHKR